MRIADRESSEFRMQLAPPPSERNVCFSVSFHYLSNHKQDRDLSIIMWVSILCSVHKFDIAVLVTVITNNHSDHLV